MEEKESNTTTPSTDPYTKEFLEEMERRRTLAGEKPITHLPYEAVPKSRTKKPQGFFVRHRILTQSVQLNVIFFCTALGAAFISGWMLKSQLSHSLKSTLTPEQEQKYAETMGHHVFPATTQN